MEGGRGAAEEVGSYPGAAWRSHGTGAGGRKRGGVRKVGGGDGGMGT